MFDKLAGFSYRHRWTALVLWFVVLAGLAVGAQLVGPSYRNDFSLPGTQSQQALDVLRAQSPVQAGATAQIVLHDDAGLARPGTDARVDAMLDQVRSLP